MRYDLWLHVRDACRRLASQPGYTAVMVRTLAIGATTAVFTVVDETLLRRAPFVSADRLVDVVDVCECCMRKSILCELCELCVRTSSLRAVNRSM